MTTAEWVLTRVVAGDGYLYAWSRRNGNDHAWQVRLETGVVVYPFATATRVKRTGVRVLRLPKGWTLAEVRAASLLVLRQRGAR